MDDLRLALRSLWHRPLFAAVAIVTLALGIGATTTLFAVVNAVLLRPLPYPDAARIVSVSEARHGRDDRAATLHDYLLWHRHAPGFAALATFAESSTVLSGRGAPVRLDGAQVSADFFHVFGTAPVLGREFLSVDEIEGGPDVVVLSYEVWQRWMGADPSAVGRKITLDDHAYTVIGVMPPRFRAPRAALYWLPSRMKEPSGFTLYVQVAGRLKPGVTMAQARIELSTLNERDARPHVASGGSDEQRTAVVMTLHDRLIGGTRPALLSLLGAVGFLLLIACANVANLQLARAASRRREYALLAALGATRWRLARRLHWESVTVSAAGGALGLLIPWASLPFILRFSPESVARVQGIHIGGQVLGFCAAVSILTGLAFGLIPALTATRGYDFAGLKDGGERFTGTMGQHRARRVLVIAELAIALVVLTGAGLLTRSFVRATSNDVGFRPDRTMVVQIQLQRNRFPTNTAARAFFERTADEIRALPGVHSVGYSDGSIVSCCAFSIRVPVPAGGAESPAFGVAQVSGGFMEATGLELVEGRFLTADDRASPAAAMVVSAEAGKLLFPGRSPIGGQVQALGPTTFTVVGVVKDVQVPGVKVASPPELYVPFGAARLRPGFLAVRYEGEAGPLKTALHRLLGPASPADLRYQVSTMQEQLDRVVAPRRFNSAVFDMFAGLALLLAAVGLYGVMAYQVTQRTQELALRVALGADRARVLRSVLREGLVLTLVGTALGVVFALALSRVLAAMLFDVSPHDLVTFAITPLVLVAVGLAACYVPARQATQVDPMVALRYE